MVMITSLSGSSRLTDSSVFLMCCCRRFCSRMIPFRCVRMPKKPSLHDASRSIDAMYSSFRGAVNASSWEVMVEKVVGEWRYKIKMVGCRYRNIVLCKYWIFLFYFFIFLKTNSFICAYLNDTWFLIAI